MRILFLVLLFSLSTACSAPTPIRESLATPTLVSQPVATPGLIEPQPTSTGALVSTVTAPTVRGQISLRNLPGVGRHPNALAILVDKIYAANGDTDNVAVIQNDRVTQYIPVGRHPVALAADPFQNRLYVANSVDKTISVITNSQVTLTQSIADEPGTLLFFENRLWVGLASKGLLYILDPISLQTQTTLVFPNAFGVNTLTGDAAHHRVYAAAYERIAVVDSVNLHLQSTYPLKGAYFTLLANPGNDNMLTGVYDSGENAQYLRAMDPVSGSLGGRVRIGGDPRGAALASDGARAYIANSYSNTLSVVNTRDLTAVAEVSVDLRPYAVALDDQAHRVYVANQESDNVSVVDTESNRVIATIPLGMQLSAFETNEQMGRVYAASASTDSLYVIQDGQVAKEIDAGRAPMDLARDPKTNRLYTANASSATLTVIDETTLSPIRTTPPITRSLLTAAVDSARSRIFAGGEILDASSLAPIGRLTLRGISLGSVIEPDLVRINPSIDRIYAFGRNGIPGSNSRRATYSVDGATLQQRGMLGYGGNTNYIAIDPETNRVFVAGTHPLAHTSELAVFDANDTRVYSLTLSAAPMGMTFNPLTHHLFIAQTTGYSTSFGPTAVPANNTVLILDTNSFGEVARLNVGAPGEMTRLGNFIYIASRIDGSITLVEDATAPAPPSPTPTRTPTPYPTLPPLSTGTRVSTPSLRGTPLPVCAMQPASFARSRWTTETRSRIGCPSEAERQVNFAVQEFERGVMYWREDERRIITLYSDYTFVVFDDVWKSGLPEDSCPAVGVGGGKIKPLRGFGKVWCDQANVRTKIGAAVGPEIGLYPVQVQRYERGLVLTSHRSGQVLVLYSDGRWD